AALDAAADAEADGTDREGPLAQSRFGGDADLVVHDLGDPAGVCRKNRTLQLDDIGPVRVFRLVPGPVEKAHQPLHCTLPRGNVRGSVALRPRCARLQLLQPPGWAP